MINLGVRAHDFGKQEPEKLAEKIQSCGFRSVQLALNKAFSDFDISRHRLTPGYGNYIRDIFQSRGINIAILGCYINPVHPDPEERERALRRFEEHLRFARDFGCAIVATETGTPRSEEDFSGLVEVVGRLAGKAEKSGTIVGIEGVCPKHTINTHRKMVRLLELVDSPNLGVVYDPANFIPPGVDQKQNINEAFELFGDKIVAVHAKDFIVRDGEKDTTLPVGQGQLDWGFILKLLEERYPAVHILLENNNPGTMKNSIAYMKKVSRSSDAVV